MIAGTVTDALALVFLGIVTLNVTILAILGLLWVAAEVRYRLTKSPSARVTAPGGGGAAGNGARPGRLPVDAAAPSAVSGSSTAGPNPHKKKDQT